MLALPYAPRRPTETVLYGVVREHLETFVRWSRETYDKPLPRYVENELRAYLRCGVFAHGFVRAHCDACGHDLLVAFSCKGRGVCPSCEAPAPTATELDAIVRRACTRILRWLGRHGHLEPRDEDADALGACASAAMQRGLFAELPQRDDDKPHEIPRSQAAAEHMGFNLHAGVRISADDDLGRERLCRYGARPALAVGRFRQLRDGKIAYRTKYAKNGRAQHRVMTPLELMARISALIPPPRYPLVRYHGVLAPSSPWRKLVIPKPPESEPQPCQPAKDPATKPAPPQDRPTPPTPPGPRIRGILLAPNILSIPHWTRLGEGVLRAATPRIDWPLLLRRTFDVDILECAKCKGRLKVKAVMTERAAVDALLSRLNITPPPKPARARDPTTLYESADME